MHRDTIGVIKLAPVYHALRGSGHNPLVLHTPQYDQPLWTRYEFFEIFPKSVIGLDLANLACNALGTKPVRQVADRLGEMRLSGALAHGSSVSGATATLAAVEECVPVGYFEAGRIAHETRDRLSEQADQMSIAQLGTWHFTPTESTRCKLEQEGITQRVYVTGSTTIDAVQWGHERLASFVARH